MGAGCLEGVLDVQIALLWSMSPFPYGFIWSLSHDHHTFKLVFPSVAVSAVISSVFSNRWRTAQILPV